MLQPTRSRAICALLACTFAGAVHAETRRDAGLLPAYFPLRGITVHLKRKPQQQRELTQFLNDVQNSASSQYHKWLSPEEFGSRFGAPAKDAERVIAWLEDSGFTHVSLDRARISITAEATAAVAGAAFSTEIHRYIARGGSHYANSSEPALPHHLAHLIAGVRGLDDFRPKARALRRRFTVAGTSTHYLSPADLATVYGLQNAFNQGLTGAGQSIAVAGQSDISISDIRAFRSVAGLSFNDPRVIVPDTDPGITPADQLEGELDIEWTGAAAPGASVIYVVSQDAFTSAAYVVSQKLASVLVISYGDCESNFTSAEIQAMETTLQQAAAEGITVIAPSGDLGAADCELADANGNAPASASHGLAVDYPASSAYVTAVGGTQFSDAGGNYWSPTNNSSGSSALSYIPEIAWNDSSPQYGIAASGGGVSILFPKPAWQQAAGVPADSARDVPDVALAASAQHNAFLVCAGNGDCANGFTNSSGVADAVGGTSAAAPAFAGIVVLVNQRYGPQGNINPALYRLQSITTDVFHDITTGGNVVPCVAGSTDCGSAGTLGYSAGAGYDFVTGLGTVEASNLVEDWTGDFKIAASPASITVSAGGSATTTVTVSSVGNFNGAVAFTCSLSAVFTNTTCSIPGTVTGSGSAVLTIANSAIAAAPPLGRNWKWPGLMLACVFAFSLAARQPRRILKSSAATLVFAALVSCGGGGGTPSSTGASATTPTTVNTPPPVTVPPTVTGTVTITARSGSVTHSTSVTLTAP